MKWLSLAIATVFAGPSHAALRFGCSTLTIQRLDPLFVGGNAFHPNMTGDIGNQGTCTTCTFTEDFSNYWTAVMYFRHTNGSYKRVPIMQNGALPTPINGGMTVYYTQQDFSSNGNVKMTAFRPQGLGLKFVCLINKGTRFPELDTFPPHPAKTCQLAYPHRLQMLGWQDPRSPDHMSHMYNTVRDAFQNSGPCPSSHPVRVPQLAYETLWDTTQFNSIYDDSRGYGTHADYVFGWKGDSLQRAMDSGCMFQGCENGRPLLSQSVDQMNACQISDMVGEDTGANN
ncbi:hypothetical protein FA13DRAFT_1748690, partial [Coprinellus micaceus]